MKKFLFQIVFILSTPLLLKGQDKIDPSFFQIVNTKIPRQLDTIRNLLLVDTFYIAPNTYKIELSKNYKATYYPRVAYNQLLLTDMSGNVQNLSVVYYEYTARLRGDLVMEPYNSYLVPYKVQYFKVNQSMEISNVRVMDINGVIKKNLLQPFVIRRIR